MQATALALLAVFHVFGAVPGGAIAQTGRGSQPHLDDALRREGEQLAQIGVDALTGRDTPSDLSLSWRNDFFKAQPGTFVPFTVTLDARRFASRAALLYVRAERERAAPTAGDRREPPAYETIFPVRIDPLASQPAHITRGFAVPPGRYRVVVVLRETAEEAGQPLPRRRTGTLVRALDVPDFWSGDLAVSTVMLADRVEALEAPVPPDELDEHPYVVGTTRIHPAIGSAFRRDRELLVVFLVYNPTVGADRHFDVQVDYHVSRKDPAGDGPGRHAQEGRTAKPGERYVTRTNPQRFNPSMMGPRFDPSSGTPVLAGQGILLAGFEPGEYRLEIRVTDLLSRASLSRDVGFTIVGL